MQPMKDSKLALQYKMCRRRENVVIGFNLETLKEKFEQASVDSYPAGVHWNNFNDWIFCKNRKMHDELIEASRNVP